MYTHRFARLFVHESETVNKLLCHSTKNHNVLVFKLHVCLQMVSIYEM